MIHQRELMTSRNPQVWELWKMIHTLRADAHDLCKAHISPGPPKVRLFEKSSHVYCRKLWSQATRRRTRTGSPTGPIILMPPYGWSEGSAPEHTHFYYEICRGRVTIRTHFLLSPCKHICSQDGKGDKGTGKSGRSKGKSKGGSRATGLQP